MCNSGKKAGLAIASAVLSLLLLCAAQPALAGPYGMMGPGMMGPGMMEPREGRTDSSTAPATPSRATALLDYLHDQDPACLQCHVVSGTRIGPSFASIAARYAGQRDAVELLARHIAHGYGRMPAGLASEAQAAQLARLIMALPMPAQSASRP